ncbi:hypothetical protein GLOTRDRAFT_123521 [Gloeophyllum trabeum ATCC 11539]|uniref:Uncharacterized protein n=1 Tax=Gloeophyllum trabeum (strain ATCC 11539 / FP-39264 / Madison 617) TaxID=670483 RepID=S7RE19_GLOTA|nr:uncharacterized protein GLOTRDRAFT_123521 [Gloeophyllum trabeum ATCC 11539]EPQ50699.1 hypothetical protein GLOTRDRAFT_123521 [Gloeophyllum trabeum ATCC 11539]
MSSIYTPLFPPTTLPEPRHPLSSSSSGSSDQDARQRPRRHRDQTYSNYLSSQHLALASLPHDIHPASRPPSPSSELRVAAMRRDIQHAAEEAGWEPSDAKWTFVAAKCRLAGTRGRWRVGARMEKGKEKWEVYSARKLPEREDDWLAWERKVRERREIELSKSKGKGKEKAVDEEGAKAKELVRNVHEENRKRPQRRRVADIIEKVAVWQATVQQPSASTMGSQAMNIVSVNPGPSGVHPDGHADPDIISNAQVQPSLPFPVVKSSSQGQLAGKGSNNRLERQTLREGPIGDPDPIEAAKVPIPRPRDVFDTDPGPFSSRSTHTKQRPGRIVSDVPESSFLQPSFPDHLQTSTPNRLRRKPAAMPRADETHPFLSSPPLSPPRSSSLRLGQSSSQPVLSVSKRARPLTPSSDDVRMRSNSLASPTALKKARTMGDAPAVVSLPIPRTPGNVRPPTTPPKSGSSCRVGLAPFTPHRAEKLPTLTELLASRQRSGSGAKRKRTELRIVPSPGDKARDKNALQRIPEASQEGREAGSPMKVDANVDPRPAALTRKLSLASPALGPSTPDPMDGPLPVFAPAEPDSPSMRFTQHPSAFLPRMASTQQPQSGGSGGYGYGDTASTSQGKPESNPGGYVAISGLGVSQSQGGLGFTGMDYNSQFDVDREVDRVNALLDKDVDFDGWLRDVTDESAADVAMKGSSQSGAQ